MNRPLPLFLIVALTAAAAQAQTVRPVQHMDGLVVSPTNFWAANSNSIATIAPRTTNADNLTAGTLPDARLSANIARVSQLAATNISGFAAAALAAAPPTTNAEALTEGTLADMRLSTNVVRLYSTNTVTVGKLTLGSAQLYYGGASPDALRVTILGTNIVTLTTESANFLPKISAPYFEAVQGGDSVRMRPTGITFAGASAAATRTNLGLGPFATATNLSASNVSDFSAAVTAIVGTNQITNAMLSLRLNTNGPIEMGGVGGVLEIEANNNHAIVAKASDITDGAAFYGWSQSGAPAAKFVQTNHFDSPALTVWRTTNGNDALSPAVLISGSPASATNKALSIRNGNSETFWVKYDGTTSITNTGCSPTNVAWAQGLTNSSFGERLVFDGMAGRLHFYASQTTDPDFGVVSSAGYMVVGTRGTNGFLQAKGNVRIEKQGGGLTGLQVANFVTAGGQTNSLPAVNATLVPWMGSASANPASPVEGALYFNTTDSTVRIYAGGSWRPLN